MAKFEIDEFEERLTDKVLCSTNWNLRKTDSAC